MSDADHRKWSRNEVKELIEVWKKSKNALKINPIKKNHLIYKDMARDISEKLDVSLIGKQVQIKINNLKKHYRQEKKRIGYGGSPSEWEWFDGINEVHLNDASVDLSLQPQCLELDKPLMMTNESTSTVDHPPCASSHKEEFDMHFDRGLVENANDVSPTTILIVDSKKRSLDDQSLDDSTVKNCKSESLLRNKLNSFSSEHLKIVNSQVNLNQQNKSELLELRRQDIIMSSNGTRKWYKKEVEVLIEVWKIYKNALNSAKSKYHIYRNMARNISEKLDVPLRGKQVQIKVNNMKKHYRQEKKRIGYGGSPSEWEWFNAINEIYHNDASVDLSLQPQCLELDKPLMMTNESTSTVVHPTYSTSYEEELERQIENLIESSTEKATDVSPTSTATVDSKKRSLDDQSGQSQEDSSAKNCKREPLLRNKLGTFSLEYLKIVNKQVDLNQQNKNELLELRRQEVEALKTMSKAITEESNAKIAYLKFLMESSKQ